MSETVSTLQDAGVPEGAGLPGADHLKTGSFTDPATGTVVHGEIARFIHGDPTAGKMTGGYLFKMFGLPGAALAIWRCESFAGRSRLVFDRR